MNPFTHIHGEAGGLFGGLLIAGSAAVALLLDRKRTRPAAKLVDQENARLLQRFADVQTRQRSEGLLATLHAAGRDDA